MTERYNLENIRALLSEGFTIEELRVFCNDEPDFKSLYDKLPKQVDKTEMIRHLLEYAEANLLVKNLLSLAKEHNLICYQKHQPYYTNVSSGIQ